MLVSESILEKLGTRLIGDLRKAQLDRGLKASGRSAESLVFTIERAGELVTLTITGSSWWRQQENGRGPDRKKGRPSPALIQIIREWIQAKNLAIPLAAAGAIAYKIKNEGIAVPNPFNRGGVLSEPLNRDRVIGLLKVDLVPFFASKFKSELFNLAA